MAKERLSNEIIAQVLTQVVENLRKDLNKHQIKIDEHGKRIQQITEKPLEVQPIDVSKIVQEREKISEIFDKNIISLRKETTNFRFLKWGFLVCFGVLVIGGLFFYFSQENSAKDREELQSYRAFFKEVPKAENAYRQWKTDRENKK